MEITGLVKCPFIRLEDLRASSAKGLIHFC